MSKSDDARVGICMGSDSDWPTMEAAAEALAEFGVRFEVGGRRRGHRLGLVYVFLAKNMRTGGEQRTGAVRV